HRGAKAQEEDLCRKSSLLLSLESKTAEAYYNYNRSLNTCMGSDALRERRREVNNAIKRPRNCGECARMQRFIVTVDGIRYDGGCPEFGTHVKNDWVCHPNVGTKIRKGVNKS
ncbi:MAG: DUF2263 domain-containing protein, partial [Kiritimatiellae bacterium]|nr:DUF2263 domain-containing protein [Kiritimatiellia bacterium]